MFNFLSKRFLVQDASFVQRKRGGVRAVSTGNESPVLGRRSGLPAEKSAEGLPETLHGSCRLPEEKVLKMRLKSQICNSRH